MKAPGHTILLARQGVRGGVRISLECTCGVVLSAGLFVVDDVVNQSAVRMDGHEAAMAHLGRVRNELVEQAWGAGI